MSIVRSCPYDINGEHCKYEKHYGEPEFLKCKDCDKSKTIHLLWKKIISPTHKTNKTILKGDKEMTQVILTFETQEQADNAVMVLSKGYKVEQWYMAVNSTMKPYCVGVYVPSNDVVQLSEEETK